MSGVFAVENVYQEPAWRFIGSLEAKEEEPAEKEEFDCMNCSEALTPQSISNLHIG